MKLGDHIAYVQLSSNPLSSSNFCLAVLMKYRSRCVLLVNGGNATIGDAGNDGDHKRQRREDDSENCASGDWTVHLDAFCTE